MNSLWILLACGVACAFAQPTCDQAALQKCEDMKPFGDEDQMFPTDLAELQKQCKQAYPGLNCFLDVIERCPSLVPEKVVNYFVGSKRLFDSVCTAGDMQRIVLENGECLNDIFNNKESVCEARAAKFTPQSCEYFRSIQSCMEDFVRHTCGGHAVEIFLEVSRVVEPMIEGNACDNQ